MNDASNTPPHLCESCAQIVKDSGLEWVLCGGLKVGGHSQPTVWRLRDKYSSDLMKKNAEYASRLAAAARLLHDIAAHVSDEEVKKRIQNFVL